MVSRRFSGQKTKAQDANAKTVVVTATKAMLAFGTEHGGFADATNDDLAKIEPSLGQARNLTIDATRQGVHRHRGLGRRERRDLLDPAHRRR